MKKYIPFTIEMIIFIYILPLFISKIPIVSGLTNMVTLVLNMLFVTLFAVFYGRRHRFSWLLPVIPAVLFLFYAYIHSFAIARMVFYCLLYVVATIIGNLTGLMFGKREEK